MTIRYVGNIVKNQDNTLTMPTDRNIPPKQEWHNHSIWEFNMKQYKPLTPKAVENLENVINEYKSLGFTAAHKDGSRKNTSIKYMITTYGVSDFKLVK